MKNNKNMPDSIKYPDAFNESKAAGFDGIFDWTWTEGCFGNTKITPMDFDGVVERNRHYLVFETKRNGAAIPKGQEMALDRLREAKSFTVMKIWGKEKPEKIEIISKDGKRYNYNGERAREIVKRWYKYADQNLSEKIDDDCHGIPFDGILS